MIHRYYQEGDNLDVAGLNQIIVLLDRSETEFTEIGWNQWRKDLVGPPHKHDDKEQAFYITSGEGVVKVSGREFRVQPGNLVYVPVAALHQTITTSDEPLTYILFNFFVKSDKEGHKTFADHIAKVKEIRKKQADTGQADVDAGGQQTVSTKPGKFVANVFRAPEYGFGSNSTLLHLDRSETEGFEMVVVKWPPHNKGAMVAHKDKEQAFFILSGTGYVTVGGEREPVKPGELIFVPRNTPHTTESLEEELSYLCMNSYVPHARRETFAQMYERIANQRIERWKSGSDQVGE